MATSRTIVESIALAHFMANATQVEQLAHNVAEGQLADSTYLRVALAHMQSRLGKPRRGKQPAQEPVLDSVHEALYKSVLKGVGPEDMDQTERNRRATFARSAASTIRFFIRAGGDVRGLDVALVTKSGLRKSVQPTTAVEGETRAQRAFGKAESVILRTAQRMARGDPEDARARVEGLMDELQKLLDELGAEPAQDVGATTTIAGGPRATPRGAPSQPAQLHRGA